MVGHKLADPASLVLEALKAMVFHPISQVAVSPTTECIPQHASLQGGPCS